MNLYSITYLDLDYFQQTFEHTLRWGAEEHRRSFQRLWQE